MPVPPVPKRPEELLTKHAGFEHVVSLAVPVSLGQAGVAHFRAAGHAALADESVRILMLRGSPEAFCRGMDLAEISSDGEPGGAAWERATNDFTEILNALHQARPITVAVVEGPTLGGGVGLAAVCDFVLATEAATFALPELLLGLVPAMILPVLGERLGLHQAKRWAMTQAKWKAGEAKSAGLVDLLVGVERLDVELGRLLRTLLRSHPRGVALLKQLVRECRDADVARAMNRGKSALNALLDQAEVRQELVAFRDYGLLPGEADT